jgi:adenylosuccinate synthase
MLTGLGVGAGALRRVIGVTKAFQTRVGAGPFPTEVEGSLAEQLRGSGENPWDEFGTTTGRPRRVGWLDGVLLRYAVRVNGLTELCLTKLDILSGIDPLKLSIAYQRNGQRFEDLPAGPSDLEGFKAQLEAQSAWDQNLWELRRWEDLPAAARTYVKRLEVLAGVPVLILSVGPERTQTIVRS